jgi:DNA (cytosine-5)-methyltransferase 1
MDGPALLELDQDLEPFQDALERLGVAAGPAWPDRLGTVLRTHFAELPSIPTLSLFSGGGGLDIGFHDVGMHAIDAVEIEQRYAASLEENSGEGELLEGAKVHCVDIREYDPSGAMDAEFVIGGPPCQTFSAAGRRASGVLGTTDARGMLFEEYVRLLDEIQPAGFLFENVYGITGAQNGEAWKQIVAAFSELGFVISHRVLDTADYGAPQHRERMIIVGTRDEPFAFPRPTHGPDSVGANPFYNGGEAVEGLTDHEAPGPVNGRFGHLLADIPPGLNYSFYTAEMGHPRPVFAWRSKFSDFLYKADPSRPVKTIKAQNGQYTGPFSWHNRPFSTAELKRLQTFPDAYELVGSARSIAEQIGNSVPPQLARTLALAVREQVFGVESPIRFSYLAPDEQLGFRKRKRAVGERYRQVAAAAIAKLPEAKKPGSRPAKAEQRWRVLGEDFDWLTAQRAEPGAQRVSVEHVGDTWRIAVGDAPHGTKVMVEPGETGWGLDIDNAELLAGSDPLSLTAAWKAFEEVLRERSGFADLVQASGYYVYAQQVTARMAEAPSENPTWRLLGAITGGAGVGVTAPLDDLAELWGVEALSEMELHSCLHALRMSGYEVRNSRTNPQIPVGSFLVPYCFPTFTPRSVQRSKSL